MMTDNAPANSEVHWTSGGGDTGRRRVEHRSFLQCGSLTIEASYRSAVAQTGNLIGLNLLEIIKIKWSPWRDSNSRLASK